MVVRQQVRMRQRIADVEDSADNRRAMRAVEPTSFFPPFVPEHLQPATLAHALLSSHQLENRTTKQG
jgi:hypothetical protein